MKHAALAFLCHVRSRLHKSQNLIFMTVLMLNILDLVKKYFFTEINLLPYLFLAVMVDSVAGIVRAYKENTLDLSNGLKKPIVKGIEYGCLLLIVNTLAHADIFAVHGKEYLGWLPRASCIYLILMEFRSALQHLSGNKNIPVDSLNSLIDIILRKSRLNKSNDTTSNK